MPQNLRELASGDERQSSDKRLLVLAKMHSAPVATLRVLRTAFRFQIVLFQLSVERRFANAQNAGGRKLIACRFA